MMKTENLIDCPVCGSDVFSVLTFRFDSGRIVRCSDCGHNYLNPPLSDEELEDIYKGYHVSEDEDSYIKTVDGWFNDPKGPYQYFFSLVGYGNGLKNRRLLDAGCGPGRFLFECGKRGADVTGIDSSLKAAQLAKKYFNLDIIQKPLESAMKEGDLAIEGFDIITAFEIIEHVKKPVEFLASLYRLLAPGGTLFISTPNFHLYHSMGKAAPSLTGYREHVHFFDTASLENCFIRCGYEVLKVVTLSQMAYGERKKHVLARVPFVNNIWRRIRHVGVVYGMKDSIFKKLDKHIEASDKIAWNGTSLVGIARRPTGGA